LSLLAELGFACFFSADCVRETALSKATAAKVQQRSAFMLRSPCKLNDLVSHSSSRAKT
jgi:hypothetical protein